MSSPSLEVQQTKPRLFQQFLPLYSAFFICCLSCIALNCLKGATTIITIIISPLFLTLDLIILCDQLYLRILNKAQHESVQHEMKFKVIINNIQCYACKSFQIMSILNNIFTKCLSGSFLSTGVCSEMMIRNASKKAGSSTRNKCRNTPGKRRGIKIYDGQRVPHG